MIDAFKKDYLKHAPYLKSLTEKNKWGSLEMPPGHWGGVEIFYRGKSDILSLFYKKENSSLRWIKNFQWMDKFRLGRFFVECVVNFKRLLKRQELFRLGKIPFNQLYKFEIAAKRPFHKDFDNIKFKYFGSIDKIAHEYGTKHKKTIEEIKKVDRIISKMDFDIIFSDHGMIDIKKVVKVPVKGDCFIDSDMARYWGNKEELDMIKKELPLDSGKIIDWKNKDYGDLIFLANSGVLIYPNFWNKQIVKAMHGYDGKDEEMKGIYILNEKGRKKDLKVKELNKILKEKINGK